MQSLLRVLWCRWWRFGHCEADRSWSLNTRQLLVGDTLIAKADILELQVAFRAMELALSF